MVKLEMQAMNEINAVSKNHQHRHAVDAEEEFDIEGLDPGGVGDELKSPSFRLPVPTVPIEGASTRRQPSTSGTVQLRRE